MTTTLHTIGGKKVKIKKPIPPIQYMGHIEFGMLSKSCKNFGICRIEPITELSFNDKNKKFENKKTLALIRVFKQRKVEMYFLKQGMEDKIRDIYFARANFLIGEDVNFIAQCSCNNKKSSKMAFIKKGAYAIEERTWGYFVSFC